MAKILKRIAGILRQPPVANADAPPAVPPVAPSPIVAQPVLPQVLFAEPLQAAATDPAMPAREPTVPCEPSVPREPNIS